MVAFQQLVGAVAGETLRGGEVLEAAWALAVKAVIARAEPECAVAALQHGPDLLARERFCEWVVDEVAAVPEGEATFGADPEVVVPILHEAACAEVGEAVSHAQIVDAVSADVADALIGGDPHGGVRRFEEGPNEVIDEPGRREIVHERTGARLVVNAATVRTDPECAGAIAEEIADGKVVETGNVCGSRNAILDVKDAT